MTKLWQTSKVKTGEGLSNRKDHILKRRGYSYMSTQGGCGED